MTRNKLWQSWNGKGVLVWKNPLSKRYLRELRAEWGKYLALFLFFTIIIGFCSGFLVADGSCKSAYDNSFEKYNVENGHFVLTDSISDELKEELEEKEDITIYPIFYKDKEIAKEHTIRLYKMRNDVNKADLMDGEYPKADDEIVIDRLYAENNEIAIGDTMKIEGKKYKVTGVVALSDYSALFKNNTDMMFDANKFTVALVTEHAFDKFGDAGLKKCYAWVNDDAALSDKKQEDKANDIKDIIKKKSCHDRFCCPSGQSGNHLHRRRYGRRPGNGTVAALYRNRYSGIYICNYGEKYD